MTDVLNTEGPIGHQMQNLDVDDYLNSSDDLSSSGEKKKKLVYTSEYLRQFDHQSKEKQALHHQIADTRNGNAFNHDFEPKDRVASDYISIIHKLKGIILASKDDNMIQGMRSVLAEVPSGKIFLFDDFSHSRVPPIQNFNFLGNGGVDSSQSTGNYSYFSAAPSAGSQAIHSTPAPSAPSQLTGTLPPLGRSSPRKMDPPPPLLIPVTPLSSTSTTSLHNVPQQPITAPAFKSPRKQPSQTNIHVPVSSISSTTSTTTGNTTNTSTPLSSANNTPTSISPSTNLPNLTGAGKMKKSPSMPVIAKTNKDNMGSTMSFDSLKQKTTPLTKGSAGTSSSSNLARSKDDSSSPPKKISTDGQVRKPMTKSVSMSAIGTDNSLPIKCTSLEEISGQIYHLTKYQAGCRFLQKKLEENPNVEHVTLIFKEIYEHLVELMVDPYGQYLIPQLMKYCDNNQRRLIVDRIAPKVEIFACHNYGIHGIQKVLQFLSPDQVESIIQSISDKVIILSKDGKGNYLIQSFLKLFSPEVNQFIYNAVMEHIGEISTHKVGCTVVNRCLDFASPQQLTSLVQRITDNSLQLVQDQFGNYVVQHILQTNKAYASMLIPSLVGHIAELSVQKFSSNVIEKCLQVANVETYELIIKELTEADILTLLQDKYANFVIQTALDVADETQHAKLVKLIVPYIHQIKTPYVIHIQKVNIKKY
eukprot:gene239-290_t